MKIVLIDDETIIAQGVSNMITRLRNGKDEIHTFTDFVELDVFLQENYCDLIITDICMEEVEGFDVIERAKQLGACSRFAIISGYNHFGYAKKSIEAGVCGYLLKPIEESELLKLIESVERDLKTENENQLTALLQDYMDGHVSYETLLVSKNSELQEFQNKQVCVIKIMEKNNSLIEKELKNTFLHVFHFDAIHSEYYAIFDNEIDKTLLTSLLNRVTSAFCAVSERLNLKGITEAYQQTKSCVNLRPFYDGKGIIFYDSVNKKFSNSISLIKAENEFYTALSKRNANGARAQLIKMFSNALCEQSVLYVESLAKKINDAIQEGLPIIRFYMYENRSALVEAVMNSVSMGERVEKVTENVLLETALAYIDANYCKSITLASVANAISVNYYYLSRLFKKHMKLNFKQYITQKRLEYGTKLLADPSLKIYEIAQLCGYENVNTFNEAFKDAYALTPSEYRAKHF